MFFSLLWLFAATFFYINQPVVTMQAEPRQESEVSSQALFGEEIIPYAEEGGWTYIESSDHYQGWIPSSTYLSRENPYQGKLRVGRLAAHLYTQPDVTFGPLLTLPYGVSLKEFGQVDERWTALLLPDDRMAFIQTGDCVEEEPPLSREEMIALSHTFLNLPYTWGGRSSFGYDCSGFVQMLYKKMGIDLKRDARQQICDPRFQTVPIDQLEGGDLIFFGQSEQQIIHVGLYLGEGTFIHTTIREEQPWLHISSLSEETWSGSSTSLYPCRIGRGLVK